MERFIFVKMYNKIPKIDVEVPKIEVEVPIIKVDIPKIEKIEEE